MRELFENLKDWEQEDCNIIEDLDFITEGHKVIYRKYSTLFFIFIIDEGESELATIDLIQNVVNLFEKNFAEISEYEFVFNPDKAAKIIDEVVTDGFVTEINLVELQKSVNLALSN